MKKKILDWIRRFRLNRIKVDEGDVYYGDPFDWIIGSHVEQAMCRMRDPSGYNRLWDPIPSFGTVRLTVDSDSMPYYRCTMEVLASKVNDPQTMDWLRRADPKRISKDKFKEMILEGKLKK